APATTTTSTTAPAAVAPAGEVPDPAYKFVNGDLVSINVYGEGELSLAQKIDSRGRIRLALVGDIELAGRSVREAETFIERLYVDRRILKNPMVNISIQSYAVRDISILGAVRGPGKMAFPPEKSTLDITDVITRAGGFLPTARSDSVRITRIGADGRETTSEINVEAMLTRRGAGPDTPKEFAILPGDRIWIPERLF
ncbi:MAG TPA: polysaccharide biosynthesis/export family protein, partial [Opitutaceae bacterium]|nr:polysaccharide biosynthesis/export family protein [Opitutaceae bacterium]